MVDIIRKQLDELMGKDRDGAMVESITVSTKKDQAFHQLEIRFRV